MNNIVDIENLTFGYKENDILLDNVNLSVNKGDYIGIIGPNGSAKSTLLKLILGFLKPIKGKISIFDKGANEFKDWHRIGYVSQKSNAFNSKFPITVEEVIKMQIYAQTPIFKRNKKKIDKKVQEVLDEVGMFNYSKRLIGNLSGGQQQRVFIARSLVNNPELILMDEPTVGIDAESQQAFYDTLNKLNKDKNISIIMITHDIGPICEHASKIVCIEDKKLHVHDTKDTLTRDHLKAIYGYNVIGNI